jgi:hypothetical protein
MKLYAGAAMAQRTTANPTPTTIHTTEMVAVLDTQLIRTVAEPIVVWAEDDKEALELAEAKAKEILPEKDGWHSHGVKIMQVPDFVVAVAAKDLPESLLHRPES